MWVSAGAEEGVEETRAQLGRERGERKAELFHVPSRCRVQTGVQSLLGE